MDAKRSPTVERGHRPTRVAWIEQYQNVLQLAKDRKGKYGGYVEGIRDFAEMGAHQGGQWPLAAEAIKRKFGEPTMKRPDGTPTDDPEESVYELTAKAKSHLLFEREHDRLWWVLPEAASAIDEIFSPDTGGCRDWDRWKQKAAQRALLEQEMKDEGPAVPNEEESYEEEAARKREEAARRERHKLALDAERKVLQAEAGLILITHRLLRQPLFVDFGRRMTLGEEKTMEERNRGLYLRHKELLETTDPDTSRPYAPTKAYAQLMKETGISTSRLEVIVRLQREKEGEPKRGQGRPSTRKRGD